MKLVEKSREGNTFALVYEDNHENGVVQTVLSFKTERTRFAADVESFANRLTDGAYHTTAEYQFFQHPVKIDEMLESKVIHIPNGLGRMMFAQAVQFYFSETMLPAHYAEEDHPGYPLSIITYNNDLNDIPGEIEELVTEVLFALSKMETNWVENEEEFTDGSEEEEFEDEDVLDKIEDMEVVDYEEDVELKGVMKEAFKTKYMPYKEDKS